MTQITKTLSIAGIVAMATMPVMADIASTDYVQSIVNNVIPKTGAVGHVLKKTATGLEWAAAPSAELKTTTGQSTTATMTQKAITDALDTKLNDNSIYDPHDNSWAFAIGPGASAVADSMAVGHNAYAGGLYGLAIGPDATVSDEAGGSIALGRSAEATTPGTFVVYLSDSDKDISGDYTLLKADGTIPAARLTGVVDTYDGEVWVDSTENNGVSGQLLQTNGDGTMSWVDSPAESIVATLNTILYGRENHPDEGALYQVEAVSDMANNIYNNMLIYNLDGQPDVCKTSKCAYVSEWDSERGEYTYGWEVVKVSE